MSTDALTIDTRTSFHDALRWSLRAADERGARHLLWVDPDFADWPLDDAEFGDSLMRWLRRPQRRLVMLASSYDSVPRRHPRFTAWRPAWSHVVDPRVPADGVAMELPTLMLDDGPVLVQLHDRVHWRGWAGSDAVAAHACRDAIDATVQRSEAAWPVRPLGI